MFAVRDETERTNMLHRHPKEFEFLKMNVRRVFRSHPRMVRFDAGSSSRQLRFFCFGCEIRSTTASLFMAEIRSTTFLLFLADIRASPSPTPCLSHIAMSAYVCLGRFYIQNMRARARASQPIHDGEERQRRRHVTMGCPLLLTEGWIEKLRPARGAVRVTQNPPQTPAEKLKDASLRLRSLTQTSTTSTPVEVGRRHSISQIALRT